MAKKNTSPLSTWILWSILVLGAFLMVTWEYFIAGFSADTSKITWLIFAFFLYGFASSLRVALYLQAEHAALELMNENQRLGDANSSDGSAMFDAAVVRINRGDRIDVRNLVAAYGTKIRSRTENIGVISNMLITIGLLGTVIGLIITITGLSSVLSANTADYSAMKAGLNKTVSGMGTAFYTTFFGALLGGVVLKVLSAEMKKSATQIVGDTLKFGELFIGPMVSRKSSETLSILEERIQVLDNQLVNLGDGLSSVIDVLDAKQEALASGLGDLVAAVEQTSMSANERTSELVDTIATTVSETSREADHRLRTIVSTLEETNRVANERLATISSAIEQSISSMNRQADERISAMADAIQQGIVGTSQQADERLAATIANSEETNRLANERLEAIINTTREAIEQTNRLSDERMQALMESVGQAAQDTHRQANERLVQLVDAMEASVEQARKRAEAHLGARASDIASKLNEAASVLSSFAASHSAAAETDEAGGE